MSAQQLEKTRAFIKEKLAGEGTGHDWWHIERVYNNALAITRKEGGNEFIVQLGALLHDVADHKFHNGDDTIGPKIAREWLEEIEVEEQVIKEVERIVKEISFKGAKVKTPMSSMEGKIVQDADRLDAIGAIGIARAFAYGGYKGREMYNPEQLPVIHESFESYKKSEGHTINHFYEKLLLLKELMNTNEGKRMAQQRHNYMEGFLKQFYSEWNSE